jgi:ankyrin repeat protein
MLAGGDVFQVMTSGPNKGASPLWALVFSGRTECLEQLLLKSCDINLCTDDGRSLVFVAAEKGHADCILKLVSAGGDIMKCNNEGRSPIFIAASPGYSACVSQLLASRADARSMHNGTSALDIARRNGHTECVRTLEAALSLTISSQFALPFPSCFSSAFFIL